jgi:tellurite resistance protein TerC
MEHIPSWAWPLLGVIVLVLVLVDLFAHRGKHGHSHKAAVIWSVVWVGAGLLFNVFVWYAFGGQMAQEYLAAYLMEKSLSLDNVFVFLVIFQSLRIPQEHQHRVLFWGIFGALVFRAVFIFLGAEAIERYGWVSYVFGAILLWASFRIAREKPDAPKENKAVGWLSKRLPVHPHVEGPHFIVKQAGRRMASPLLVALLALELTDILFAVDSVPAAFAVSQDRFILYSSNVFAILGLRALYIVLANSIQGLRYLHLGLAVVLGFAGVKMILHDRIHLHPLLSVGIIVAVMVIAVVASLRARKKEGHPPVVEAPQARNKDGRPVEQEA